MNTKQATGNLKAAANLLAYTIRHVMKAIEPADIDTDAMGEHLSAVAKALILTDASNKTLQALRNIPIPAGSDLDSPMTCHELGTK